MKFPILYKKKRLFVWYADHWINIHHSVIEHGGGIKGYYRFFKEWMKCVFGRHSYIHVFTLEEGRELQCRYCRKIPKENE